MKTIIASCAALAIATLGAPAHADSNMETVSVNFADLDLRNGADVERLNLRLSQAINSVCGTMHARSSIQFRNARKCKRTLTAQANQSIARLQQSSVRVAQAITFKLES